ncbi:hypothetical protein AXW67_03340 [Bradyrhizobium neotropicale]|uniref:Uncharacterized protein n=1 Tax=Bradyrhizobium neotropicale TaxID=1497615 RepID=A0A176ZD36_9BRAD|nr:hypothetical protein AXW67_03340 [Bradyrhizobium neotropicale]
MSGTAKTFESTRAAFLAASAVFLSKRTEVDFRKRREELDGTEICHVGLRQESAECVSFSVTALSHNKGRGHIGWGRLL